MACGASRARSRSASIGTSQRISSDSTATTNGANTRAQGHRGQRCRKPGHASPQSAMHRHARSHPGQRLAGANGSAATCPLASHSSSATYTVSTCAAAINPSSAGRCLRQSVQAPGRRTGNANESQRQRQQPLAHTVSPEGDDVDEQRITLGRQRSGLRRLGGTAVLLVRCSATRWCSFYENQGFDACSLHSPSSSPVPAAYFAELQQKNDGAAGVPRSAPGFRKVSIDCYYYCYWRRWLEPPASQAPRTATLRKSGMVEHSPIKGTSSARGRELLPPRPGRAEWRQVDERQLLTQGPAAG